jgi:hypothetical protein
MNFSQHLRSLAAGESACCVLRLDVWRDGPGVDEDAYQQHTSPESAAPARTACAPEQKNSLC